MTPAHAESLSSDAREHIREGEFTEARRLLSTEISIHPGNLHARYNLAVLLEQIEHDAEAYALYEENMQHGWHLPTVVNLSQVYRVSGKRREAKKLLEKASRRFRSEASPYYLLAEMAEEDRHMNDADGWYRKALRADPLNGYAHLRFSRFLKRSGNLKLALKHARRAARLLPDSATSWKQLASIHRKSGALNDALAAYQRSLAIQPDTQTRQQMIDLLHQMGEHERAERMQQSLDAYLRHHRP